MTNHSGKRGPPWTKAEEGALRALLAEGATHVEISRAIGRTLGAVSGKINNIRMADHLGPPIAFGQRFESPPPRANDDHKHLSRILAADPGGYRWLRAEVAARFYILERGPPDKSFWRAA